MRAERVLSRAADLINRSQCLREARGPDSGAGTEKHAALTLNQRRRVHSPQSHLALKRFHATKTHFRHPPINFAVMHNSS
jgi:hypothetical protein